MHHSLCIPEIVDLIFAELDADSEVFGRRRGGGRDFAALARTCKSFRDPALDFLWCEQDTITNLLKCLPSHLWKEEARDSSFLPPVFRITAPIQTADWRIPLEYALRIQKLNLKFTRADPVIFEIIDSGLPCDYLCPNLKKISWQFDDNDDFFPYIRLFLGPKIVDATILLPNSGSHISSLPGLALRLPELQQLAMYTVSPRHDPPLWRILSEMALNLERIETLIFDQLDRPAIEHLSQLPALRTLNLNTIISSSSNCCAPAASQPHPFPALRELYFCDATIDSAAEFLDLLSDCRLQKFYVAVATISSTKFKARQLYTALATHLSHTALETLRVELSHQDEMPAAGSMTDSVVDGGVLATLFCFANLAEVALEAPVGFDIDDATAWDMARAWPRLKLLCVDAASRVGRPSSNRMTLHAFRGFAKHCNELAHLAIAVDASTVPPSDQSPEMTISQHSLTYLNISTSRITDALAIAPFLSGLFPNLRNISTCDNGMVDENGVNYHTEWREVETLLRKASPEAEGGNGS